MFFDISIKIHKEILMHCGYMLLTIKKGIVREYNAFLYDLKRYYENVTRQGSSQSVQTLRCNFFYQLHHRP